MKTLPIYLEDSYATEMNAEILDVQPEGTNTWRLVLNQTIFYPMGGGQPTDQGTLTLDGNNIEVYQVMMKDGEIWHYIKAEVPPAVGSKVAGKINWDRRYKHMRLHSAGHVIDFAMYLLGYSPQQLVPLKGDHGKKPYIIYQGTVDKDIKDELQAKARELVAQDLKFNWQFQPLEQLQAAAIYLQPGLPANKPLRSLTLESVGTVADGGTQVKSTQEVGEITITDVKTEEGNTIVTYGIN